MCVLLNFLPPAALADPADADEALLKDAKIATDGPGLVDYFRQRVNTTPSDDTLKALVEQLGDDSFRKREQASRQLVAIGARARPFLRQATNDADYEIAFRARTCLGEIEQGGTAKTLTAAVRLLAVRKPDNAVPVLLDFLPTAEDETVAAEVRAALVALAVRDGKTDPALVAGLQDKNAARRAACGTILACAAAADQLPAVRKLLEDSDPVVRLRVGLALAAAQEKDAVPVLIELLGQVPAQDTGPIEELLYRLAEDKAPVVAYGTDEAARRKLHDAWAAWWKDNAKDVDATRLERATKSLGFTLVVLLDANKIVDLDGSNRVRFTIDGLQKPLDAQPLPGDRVLVAEHDGDRVTERNRKNEIVWQKEITGPLMAQRLPTGNTVIATRTQIVEVDKTGKTVSTFALQNGELIMKALRLPDGDLALVTQANLGAGVSQYRRLDNANKERRSFPVEVRTFGGKIDVLANGHVIVPDMNGNRVVEYDEQGKNVWEAKAETPIAAVRLANGHTLVTSYDQHRAVELDRAGKEVWEFKSDTRVTRAFRR